jgi:hypothetical protein
MAEQDDHHHWTITPIMMKKKRGKPSRFKYWMARHLPKYDGVASKIIIISTIAIGTLSISPLLMAISNGLTNIAISSSVLFLLSMFCLLHQADMLFFADYAGRFVGRLTIDHNDYIVSSVPTRILSDTLGISQDTIDNWPYWHGTTNSRLSFYALSKDARPIDPENFRDIDNDCLSMMKNPSDDRGAHLEPAPSVASLKLKQIDFLKSKLTSSRRMLDDTVRTLNDLGIPDDDHVASLLKTLNALEQDANIYLKDESKLTPIMKQLDEVASSSNAIYEETHRLYHDIAATHEASASIDQLRQKITVIRCQTSKIAG